MLSVHLVPAHHVIPAITVTVVIAGMLVLAALDVWRLEVEDYATLLLGVVAVVGLAYEGVDVSQWFAAVLSAAIAFAIYAHLGLRGFMGGGDVKLSVVPAFVLGACNPFLGIWWVAVSIVIQQVIFVAIARVRPVAAGGGQALPIAVPHVPAMATSMVVAAAVFGAPIL